MPKQSKKSKRPSTPHGSKVDPEEAGAWLYLQATRLGLDVEWMTREQAYGIIRRMRLGMSPMEAAKEMRLSLFKTVGVSEKQLGYMKSLGLPTNRCACKHHASLLLDAHLKPLKLYSALVRQIDKAISGEQLEMVGREVRLVEGVLRQDYWDDLAREGKKRRQEIEGKKKPGEAF